jgi:hypothetical protein
LNGTHQLLGYIDDINSVVENIQAINKSTVILPIAIGINTEKTQYMFSLMSRTQDKIPTKIYLIDPSKMW